MHCRGEAFQTVNASPRLDSSVVIEIHAVHLLVGQPQESLAAWGWRAPPGKRSALQERQVVLPSGELEYSNIVLASVGIQRISISISLPG